jgi:uncharacterized protein
MPVRLLSSSVLKWPSREAVLEAAARWAGLAYAKHAEVRRIGCFGSYARGDAGVGSDLDMVVIVSDAFKERAIRELDATRLPVPVDLLVYSAAEWRALQAAGGRFARVLADETVWFPGVLAAAL